MVKRVVVSDAKWNEARALYECGKPMRAIEKELDIPFSTINNRAKKEGWQQGCLEQLIVDKAVATASYRSLEDYQRRVVDQEVDRVLEAKVFYSTHARKVSRIVMDALEADPTALNSKLTMETLKQGLIVEGVVPFYSSQPSVTVNNANAVQTNVDKKVSFEVVTKSKT